MNTIHYKLDAVRLSQNNSPEIMEKLRKYYPEFRTEKYALPQRKKV